jgi:hypothetical protein
MEDLKGQAFVRKKLRGHFVGYLASGIAFLLVLASILLLSEYRASLTATVDRLAAMKISLIKVRSTMGEMNRFLDAASSAMPRDIVTGEPSKYLYSGLDTIRGTMGKAQLTVSKIERKDDEVLLPVTVSGPVGSYPAFVGALSHLQDMRFPFFTIAGLTMKVDKDAESRPVLFYELRGLLSTPQVQGTTGQAQPQETVKTQ